MPALSGCHKRLTFAHDIWQARNMQVAFLSDRGVVKVEGSDARKFLNGLITSEMAEVTPAQARYAALLTPQGKIIADFIVAEAADGAFLLDCARALAPVLAERLSFYKLRAKVTVEDISAALGVLAIWGGDRSPSLGICYRDPRLPELGLRCLLPPSQASDAAARLGATLADAAAYEAHRIALGVPSGGADFRYGDAFPHEADMDQLHGVDFDKGCFVGQEVVSRMEHRGIARTRIVPFAYSGAAPQAGAAVAAGGKNVGTMGSAAAGRALATVRIDRVDEAIAAGLTLDADGIPIELIKPSWIRFAFPGEAKGQ
jgi:folate-binding protein YgfZ